MVLKVLVVGSPNSARLARWLRAALGSGHSFWVMASRKEPYQPALVAASEGSRGRLRLLGPHIGQDLFRHLLPSPYKYPWVRRAAHTLKPDLVHAIGLQGAGYICSDALPRGVPFCVTNDGADLSLLREGPGQAQQLRHLFTRADFSIAESTRGLQLARELGFTGVDLGPVLTGSGISVSALRAHRQGPPSQRRTIVLRGDTDSHGRAFMALDALLPLRERLARLEIVVDAASEDLRLHAHVLHRDHGLRIETITPAADRSVVEEVLGRARVSVAVSISGGSEELLLQAMVAGAFPVHTRTEAAGELVVGGESILFVDPHRPDTVTAALERALTDDALVDAAAQKNEQASHELLDESAWAERVCAVYEQMGAAIQTRQRESGRRRYAAAARSA